ncbi:MAG: hypothetical protein SOX72_04525 [Oscillospiraceae bacterium]|nr:hypothetical protein [Oscillospiraceae bacterium]MDY4191464.1 hypothetical protein [Oscillospiraceae bacterium]
MELMGDVFIEHLVKKRSTPLEWLLRILLLLGAALLSVVLFLFSGALGVFQTFAFLLIAGVVYGAWYLFTGFSVEFEYSITNGEMDVDKIIAQRKRKRLISVKCKDFETFGRYKPEEHANRSYQTKVLAYDSSTDDVWYCTFHSTAGGNTLLVFNATEKMLNAMKTTMPKPLVFENFIKKQPQ